MGRQVADLAQQLQTQFAVLATDKDLPRLTTYWTILRDAEYTQSAEPIEVQGDRVLLTVDVVKRDDFAELQPPQWDALSLTINATGFLAIDVSVGVLFNRLHDYAYSFHDQPLMAHDTG